MSENKSALYIARRPCGCVVAATVDDADKRTARDVADFIRQGLTIERVTFDKWLELTLGCTCGKAKAAEQKRMAI